jgi:hypothetical protein
MISDAIRNLHDDLTASYKTTVRLTKEALEEKIGSISGNFKSELGEVH